MQMSASEAHLRGKMKNFTLFCSFREYFRHANKLHTSQQLQPHTKRTNSTRTHARFYYCRRAASRACGPDRAAPGITYLSCDGPRFYVMTLTFDLMVFNVC